MLGYYADISAGEIVGGAFDPGAFDPGAFDTVASSVTDYEGVEFRVLLGAKGEMGDRFPIKRQDTRPPLLAILRNPDGTRFDLTDASEVKLVVRGFVDGRLLTIVNSAVSILTPRTDGRVRHTWTQAQTARAGQFLAEFQITNSNGSIQTIPNGGYFSVDILEDLNPVPELELDAGTQIVMNETPQGDIDGVNATFVLANAPNPANSLTLVHNGMELLQGKQYTLAGSTITFITTPLDYRPVTGAWLRASYLYQT